MIENEQLNGEFFKQFFQEDLYLISGEKSADPVQLAQKKTATPVSDAFAEAKQAGPAKELPFVTFGENRKKTAVILNVFPNDFAAVRQNQMLTRLLAAIGLAPTDVLFVNLTGPVDNLQQLYDALPFDQSILFIAPKHPLVLKEKLKQFQPMSVKGKYVIAAAEISALESYVDQKKQLWTGLQAMFL